MKKCINWFKFQKVHNPGGKQRAYTSFQFFLSLEGFFGGSAIHFTDADAYLYILLIDYVPSSHYF